MQSLQPPPLGPADDRADRAGGLHEPANRDVQCMGDFRQSVEGWVAEAPFDLAQRAHAAAAPGGHLFERERPFLAQHSNTTAQSLAERRSMPSCGARVGTTGATRHRSTSLTALWLFNKLKRH